MSRRRASQSSSAMSFFSFQDIVAATLGVMILTALLLALDPLSDSPEQRTTSTSQRGTASQEEIDSIRQQVEDAKAALEAAAQQLAAAQHGAPLEAEEVERMERMAEDMVGGAESAETAEAAIMQEAVSASDRAAKARDGLEQSQKATLALEAEYSLAARRARVQYRPGERADLLPVLVELAQGKVSCGTLDGEGTPLPIPGIAPGPDANAVLAQVSAHCPAAGFYLLFVLHPGQEDLFAQLMQEWYARGYEVGWQLWDSAAGGIFDDPEAAAAADAGATGGAP